MPTIEEDQVIKAPVIIPPTGIVSSAAKPDIDVEKSAVDSAAPATIDKPTVEALPTLTEVDQPTETVEGRLKELTSGESRYVNLARDTAERSANKRGMINSAMAAGMGEEAAIKAALPIAQQDAETYARQRELNQAEQSRFNINQQSTELNQKMAEFESTLKISEMKIDADLKLKFETALNDVKFSDEVKLQYVATMNNIIRDSNQQVTDIGMSDRTAEQQATAIDLVMKNRDAELAVYQDLLAGFNDWDWGTDFTPDKVADFAPTPASNLPISVAPNYNDPAYHASDDNYSDYG